MPRLSYLDGPFHDPYGSETQQTRSAKLCRAGTEKLEQATATVTLIVGLKTMIRAGTTLDAVNSRPQDLICMYMHHRLSANVYTFSIYSITHVILLFSRDDCFKPSQSSLIPLQYANENYIQKLCKITRLMFMLITELAFFN